mmetsp:Transcript_38475/g.72138  ORF Transcript_38475/g.72138 Transcript_38475/m.72138 type:complete len:83 (+) Transcript_38475:64-312(+)
MHHNNMLCRKSTSHKIGEHLSLPVSNDNMKNCLLAALCIDVRVNSVQGTWEVQKLEKELLQELMHLLIWKPPAAMVSSTRQP